MKKYLNYIKTEKFLEIVRYGIFGVITSLINFVIYTWFIKIGFHYLLATIVSYFIAVMLSYYFNVKYVFKENFTSLKYVIDTLYKFLSVRLGAILIELVLMFMIVDMLKIDEIIAKIICSVITITGTYFFNKVIIKKGDKIENDNKI